MTFDVVDEVPVDPTAVPRARVYAEGWQSWSPATWYAVGADGLRPEHEWQHTMRFRPGAPLPATGLQAEGLLVVDPGNGEAVRCFGASEAASAIPTLRAVLDGSRVVVSADGEVRRSHHPEATAALAAYGEAFATRAGVGELRAAPRVWCSWYRYFETVTAADIVENLHALDEHELPVEVVQVDDGWSVGLGEGLVPTERFGSLERLVDEVAATGRQVGIWLAPFLVGAETTLAREHPDWLVGEAGRNWGQDLRGLDLTHPAVRDLLATAVSRLRDLGVAYLKLDFLYAGALPGRRHEDVSAIEAYRSGLALIREAAGAATYVLGCGAPILPSVGLVDGMRVSPDTFHLGGEDGSAGLRGLMPLAARAWQQGRLWVNDPDCLVTRPSYALRESWADANERYGGLRSFSDRVADLDEWGLRRTRMLLQAPVPPRPFDDEVLRAGARTAEAVLADRMVEGVAEAAGSVAT